jgi:hypothetical protein
MLLSVSVLATLVAGLIGYLDARAALQAAALEHVTSVRESRASAVEREFANMRTNVILDSRNDSVIDATVDFTSAFAALGSAPISPEQHQTISSYYHDVFVPQLEEHSGYETDEALFAPTSSAQQYLQLNYTIPPSNSEDAAAVEDAGDGSAWSVAHATYHDYFKQMVALTDYEDVMLLDTSGNVVYSVYKGVDLGTNIESGPYSTSALADAYQAALRSNTVDTAVVTDFSRYQPSLDAPTAWVASPVGRDGVISGVLAAQVPLGAINSITTDDGEWLRDGMGVTGETILVGPDELMRSIPRLLVDDPEEYERAVVDAGTAPDVAARQLEVGGSVLLQPVNTTAVERALRGETGTVIGLDYTGAETLAAYEPLKIDGLEWVVISKVDATEAFAPIDDLTRTLLLSIVAIIIVVSLLSLLLAQVFVRPVRRLQRAVNRITSGELGATI